MNPVNVCINGKNREVPSGTTLEELIEQFQLKKKSVVLELNHKVIERGSYSDVRLKENDAIEIVQFVGGG